MEIDKAMEKTPSDYTEFFVLGSLIGLYYAAVTVIAPKICAILLKTKYTTLTTKEKASVDVDVVSGVNGLGAFIFAVWILLRYDFSEDYLGTNLFHVRVLSLVQAAYFIADLLLLFRGSAANSPGLFLIHHFSCLLAYYAALVLGLCQFHLALRTVNEMSTIFYNGRSVLSTLKMKDSRFYVINGLLFMVTFFIARILMIPVHYYTWRSIPAQDFLKYNPYISLIFYTASVPVDILNVYWFSLVFRGFLKYCTKHRDSQEGTKKE